MSNAEAVTPSLRGGGHSTALLLTTGGFCHALTLLAVGNKLVGFVPPLVFRVLLFHMWRRINKGQTTLPGVCLHFIWDPPDLTHYILVLVRTMLTHGGVHWGPHQMDEPDKIRCKTVTEASPPNGPPIRPFAITSSLHRKALRGKVNLNDRERHFRGLCAVLFITLRLKWGNPLRFRAKTFKRPHFVQSQLLLPFMKEYF